MVTFGSQSQAGTISRGASCAFNNYTFNDPGSIRPMIRGVPTGTATSGIGQ